MLYVLLFYIYSRVFHRGFNLPYVYCIPLPIGINNYYNYDEFNKTGENTIQEHWKPNNDQIKDELLIYRSSYKNSWIIESPYTMTTKMENSILYWYH
ncbi:hypothetical protein CMK18_19420 [Candidatus Poribacteria bacterium]|nr:hypothetical protein [Candidatus Poribacteria bacterium]